ncbi:uncharacterized protein [Lepeophtheirus salmonis]|nr:proton channel OtopLc-like [Lepeophtheirus salmonis]
MKAWSRSQYERPQTDAELISSYLQQHAQQANAGGGVAPQPYGVPIPPPLVPEDQPTPLPPPRSTSSNPSGGSGGGGRSKGKRSRHSGGNSRSGGSGGGDSHYSKYDVYKYDMQQQAVPPQQQQGGQHCSYANKYVDDCHFSKHSTTKECDYNKTWPKQHHYQDDPNLPYTQDDHTVQYVHEQQQQHYDPQQHHHSIRDQHQHEAVAAKYAQVRKKQQREAQSLKQAVVEQRMNRDKSPLRGGTSASEQTSKQIAELEAQQALAVVAAQQTKVKSSAKQQEISNVDHPGESQSASTAQQPQPSETSAGAQQQPHTVSSTFNPNSAPVTSNNRMNIEVQQEHIQYVDNDCCQVAVVSQTAQQQPSSALQQGGRESSSSAHGASSHVVSQSIPHTDTATLKKKSKSSASAATSTATAPAVSNPYATLERNMAEHAAQQARDREATIDRKSRLGGDSCDTCDAPLTPASLAGIDHRDLENRPLTRSVTRATVYDEPPEKTSLFITCSGLYGTFVIITCIAFLSAEISTLSVPLHYFEGFFTYLYLVSILFLLYVFCYLLHESNCCGGEPMPGSTRRNTYFQNLPRDALPDGSPVREKLAHFTLPKKHKTSENDYSHGSFFLRVGGIAFGLGTMIYNGLELGIFFEIPWNSPCYQVLRGINPILQMVFTFSQMYFVFMNARLNIHKFKCIARFGLMHVVVSNLCVWLRTVVKEITKEIAHFRVERGQGVSEDYMILEGYNTLRRKFGDDSFFVNGPYAAIMSAIYKGSEGVYSTNPFSFFSLSPDNNKDNLNNNLIQPQSLTDTITPAPYASLIRQQPSAQYFYSPTTVPQPGDVTHGSILRLANNFTCGRQYIMGNIVQFSAPYLYPFVIQYSMIAASVLFVMWKRIGKSPRYWGEEDDHISVASRKMTNYAKTDCVGASKGLFFGLLTLVVGLICLILFFVLIDHENTQVSELAVFLADLSHVVILILAILAILLGFIRVTKMKFHGEDSSILGDYLLRVAACGIIAYAIFNIIAGGLGDYTDLKNLLVLSTGGVTIIQAVLQLLFITDAQRRRIHSLNHDNVKPGRQVVTFLLICNLTMWIIFTFEVQKVQGSPVQLKFYGFYTWTVIQRIVLPLCIFFRFHSTVILAEIWKNSYKAKLID